MTAPLEIRRSGDAEGSARDRLRWELADKPRPQVEMFPGLVHREVGRGEFRGLEFLEVEAKQIINTVPAAARLPFRHTINAYRGCSHACSYCLAGETPVLMADGRIKELAAIEVGDCVCGTERRGASRRYVTTEVTDHWRVTKPAYRVVLEDGTELIASGDHRFLTDRGWQHVVGGAPGAGRRPHLTTGDELVGTGKFAEAPKHDADYRIGYLCGLIRGEADLDHASYPRVARIEALVRWPTDPSDSWRRGFLAGIFDAGGRCRRGIWRVSHTDEELVRRVRACMRSFGFCCAIEQRPSADRGALTTIRLLGGVRERLRFFHTVDPAIERKGLCEGWAVESNASLGVIAVESLGFDVPMIDITTGTGDFIADGVVSHNCFARPTHEYLDLDSGRDFETKLVVKINAVERLRAELKPRRWAGDHIAMGTNTDPYQRCEGKYRLTRGIVETLAEHANPFSMLTKSTLVLRDLDVLADAAARTDVSVNFSIGTLDPDVWRLTEPDTPNPVKRVEAVARLNEAGVPSGVLVAPVIPGISDHPDQLEAVVKACVEAGAHSISPIVLHLRSGVREHFMSWLDEHRPELLRRYRSVYRRGPYAPDDVQRRITETVRDLVNHFGGTVVEPSDARRSSEDVAPSPGNREREPLEHLEQLQLGVPGGSLSAPSTSG